MWFFFLIICIFRNICINYLREDINQQNAIDITDYICEPGCCYSNEDKLFDVNCKNFNKSLKSFIKEERSYCNKQLITFTPSFLILSENVYFFLTQDIFIFFKEELLNSLKKCEFDFNSKKILTCERCNAEIGTFDPSNF